MLGEEIAILFSATAEAGQEYKFVFGSDLTEGLYYYQLQSGTKISVVKKMMLIK